MLRRTLFAALAVTSVATAAACSNANAERAAQLAADSAAARNGSRSVTPRIRTRTIPAGATLSLASVTDVTSQKDQAGKTFTARTLGASRDAAGETVIPVGAELIGTVTVLKSAPTPGSNGQLEVAFTTLRFGGQDYPIDTRVLSLGTRSVARGVTVDDAAKVGVGAAAGAIAGRVIGGNRTGTVIGAVGGGAAGAVYANRTKDHDIVLSPGSAVEIALTSPFSRRI